MITKLYGVKRARTGVSASVGPWAKKQKLAIKVLLKDVPSMWPAQSGRCIFANLIPRLMGTLWTAR